jgi:hypothetical protein
VISISILGGHPKDTKNNHHKVREWAPVIDLRGRSPRVSIEDKQAIKKLLKLIVKCA